MTEKTTWRKVGVLWKPRPGGKSKGNGTVTVNGFKQSFVILPNEDKKPGSRQPDYVLLSTEDPQPDDYQTKRQSGEQGRESNQREGDAL